MLVSKLFVMAFVTAHPIEEDSDRLDTLGVLRTTTGTANDHRMARRVSAGASLNIRPESPNHSDEMLAGLKTEPTELPAWDPMGSLARQP